MALLCSTILGMQNQPLNGVCNLPACLGGSLKAGHPFPVG